MAPKEQAGLSPYEMLYRKPFIYVNDLLSRGSDPPVLYHGHWAVSTRYKLVGVNQDPNNSKEPPLYAPATQVLINSGKMGPQRLNSSPNGRAPTL